MQKRKSLFSIAVVVLVLVLAVAMLVACNNQKDKYTITFDDGSGVTKTVTVEEGSAIPADQLPADLSKLGHKFLGWYNGETKFEEGMTFKADATFVAKFERTGYVITLSFAPADKEDMVTVVALDNATFPDNFIPATAPTVDKKAFKGYFNGNVKAEVGIPITGDVTFSAQYYGDEIYTGLYVDETNKIVAKLDSDYLYFGKEYISRESFKFDTTTGAFEFEKPASFGAGWTLAFVDGKLNVTKITNNGNVDYVMTEVVDDVDYAGTYVKDSNSTLTVLKGGFVIVGSTPNYQYLKISATNDGYVLTAVESEGADAATATVTFDNDGNMTISDIEKGVWLKGATVEFSISGGETSITKFSIGATKLYVYKHANGETEFVTVDKELTKTDGDIVTITLQDSSTVTIKVTVTDTGYGTTLSYETANSLRGTYTVGAQTLVFDGFGKVTATSTDVNGYNGTYSCNYNDRDQLVVGNLFIVNFVGNSVEIIAKDSYVGTYKVLGAGSLSSTITLDGFGYVETIDGSVKSTGSYTVSGDTITITATIASEGENNGNASAFNGEYTVLYDGETLTKDDTYWCKEGGDDKFDELRGEWVNEYDNTLVIDAGAGIISIEFNGTSGDDIKVLKPDRSVITFTFYGSLRTVTIGETENTIKLSWGESSESIYNCNIAIDEAFFGTWSNDDETIKVQVVDKNTVNVDFDATEGEDTLVSATLSAASAEEFTIVVDSKNYTISINNGELTVTSSDDSSVNYQLQKNIIADKFIGSWKAQNEAEGPLDLVVTGKKVTLNGVVAVDIQAGTGSNLKFAVNGVNYTFWALSFMELDYDGNEITMVDANASSGGGDEGDAIITNSEFNGTWTWNDEEMNITSGTIEIAANSVKINGVEVTNLVENTDSGYYFEITFTYDGKNYMVYKQYSYSFSALKIQLQEGSYPEAVLS